MGGTTRYILRQLTGPMVFITLSLAGVIWLSQSLRIVDKIINDGISFSTFLYMTTLLLPSVLMIILPIALFCAVIYAYNRMASESELVVLWAAGFSQRALARPALILATAVMVVCYVIALYLMPLGNRAFKNMQWDFRANLTNLVLQEGVFNSIGSGLTVYVRSRQADGELRGILVHDSRVAERPVTLMAERGMLVRNTDGTARFVMVNGNRQQVEADRRQLSLLYFDSYSLDLAPFASASGEPWWEPNERYLNELLWPGDSPDDIEHYWRIIVEGHRRLATPLYALALALVGVAAIMSGQFSRRGQGRRIGLAAAAAVLLQVAALANVHLATRMPVLLPLLYLTPILAGLAAVAMLGWTPRRPPPEPTSAGALA